MSQGFYSKMQAINKTAERDHPIITSCVRSIITPREEANKTGEQMEVSQSTRRPRDTLFFDPLAEVGRLYRH